MPIKLDHIWKSYGEKPVLQDLSHVFPEGETTCVMGPSGCGKTTLLRLLLGLEAPDRGTVSGLEGRKRSAVFQEDRLCENVSAVSNLRLVNPGLSRREAEAMLDALGLSDSLHQPIRDFSGGMKRRAAILRALAAEHDVLLADEPFKGLDEETKRRVMEYFRGKTAGKTVVLVTHETSEADFLGGRLLRLPSAPPISHTDQ